MPRSVIPRNTASKRIQVTTQKRSIHHTFKQGTLKLHKPVAPYHDPVKI
jgi:hypothetical protein